MREAQELPSISAIYTYRIKVIVKLRECGLESPAESLESQCHEFVLHLVRQIRDLSRSPFLEE